MLTLHTATGLGTLSRGTKARRGHLGIQPTQLRGGSSHVPKPRTPIPAPQERRELVCRPGFGEFRLNASTREACSKGNSGHSTERTRRSLDCECKHTTGDVYLMELEEVSILQSRGPNSSLQSSTDERSSAYYLYYRITRLGLAAMLDNLTSQLMWKPTNVVDSLEKHVRSNI